MDWIERMNRAIAYIEEHITEEIGYGQVAGIACCSSYHFQRMFAYLADVPLSEYIRRRRMSLAVADLQSGNEKIIDVTVADKKAALELIRTKDGSVALRLRGLFAYNKLHLRFASFHNSSLYAIIS